MMPRPKIVITFNRVALNMATELNKSVMPPAPDANRFCSSASLTIGSGTCQPTR